MSKKSSITTMHTVWCRPTFKPYDGHEGYKQFNQPSQSNFIESIESQGWQYIKDDWCCPACAKEIL